MTTYPLGYLSAAWIAFEDIDPDSGPLVFYPGSHRLEYVFSNEVGISESEFQREGYRSGGISCITISPQLGRDNNTWAPAFCADNFQKHGT